MDYFKVSFKGCRLGGVSIVKADNPEHAISLVKENPKAFDFTDVEVEVIYMPDAGVLYIDDGDY